MTHRVVTDKDGRMRTELATPPKSAAEMERMRREVRDHITGNTGGWHVDPNTPPPAPVVETSIYDDPDWFGFMPDAEEHN